MERDAGCLTDQTATSVAPDEVVRPQRVAVGQRLYDTIWGLPQAPLSAIK